jgi:hypothetical protein
MSLRAVVQGLSWAAIARTANGTERKLPAATPGRGRPVLRPLSGASALALEA